MRGDGEFRSIVALIVAVILFYVWLFWDTRRVIHAAERVPVIHTLTELDQRTERRHGELLVRIESLRRQMLALHGQKELK